MPTHSPRPRVSARLAREFPIDKDEVYRDRLGSQPSANQLQLEHGYPAYYCLLFTVVRATGLNRNTFAQKMQSDSSKWLYAVISHGQFSFKTRMVNAAVADWTKPMYGSDEVAGSDLICPLSNNLLEQQYVKVTLYTYWRDKDGFAEQKLGSTRVHFKDGIAVNKVVKMDYAMDEGGQLLVQYAVFDRKVLGEMLFPKIKSEQHRQEVRRFCKRRKRHPTTRYTGLRLGATALTPRVDTPTSPTVEVWCAECTCSRLAIWVNIHASPLTRIQARRLTSRTAVGSKFGLLCFCVHVLCRGCPHSLRATQPSRSAL